MSDHVLFEDRTTESPEQARQRQLAGPAAALANNALQMAGGHPSMAIHLLAMALGQSLARTGAPAEAIAPLVTPYHESARAMLEEQLLLFSRHADA